ncbi:bacteriophage holin [Candidatus Woesearchaeota archaeon]|nr:bacteriophage holin [Candidatus Woesearchaeota archaeon]
MKINEKNFGLAGGLIAGVTLFIMTLFSISTGYAQAFLEIVMSIYPGYSISAFGSLVGLVYGFIDGFIGLYLLAMIYNIFEKGGKR